MSGIAGTTWTIRLFGDFCLERDGIAVDRFGSRKEEQVLARIAMNSTAPELRDGIVADVWPDLVSSSARKQLSQSLFVLRKRFAKAGLGEPFVDVGNSRVFLSPRIRVDVQLFSEAVAAATSDTDGRGLLENALASYGSGLLPGVDVPWVALSREKLDALYQVAVERLEEIVKPTAVQRRLLHSIPSTAWRGLIEGDVPVSTRTPSVDSGLDLLAVVRQAEDQLASGADSDQWMRRISDIYPAIEEMFVRAESERKLNPALETAGRMWRFWHRSQQLSVGCTWLEKLLALGDFGSRETRALALHALGNLYALDGDAVRGKEALQAARSIWHRQDIVGVPLLRTVLSLGMAHQLSGDLEDARDHYQQALAMAKALGAEREQMIAHGNLALFCQENGEWTLAREHLLARLALIHDSDPTSRGETLSQLATVELFHGHYEEAKSYGEDAIHILNENGLPHQRSLALQVVGRAAGELGLVSEALKSSEEALEQARLSKRLRVIAKATIQRAFVLKLAGKFELAEAKYGDGCQLLRSIGDDVELARLRVGWEEESP